MTAWARFRPAPATLPMASIRSRRAPRISTTASASLRWVLLRCPVVPMTCTPVPPYCKPAPTTSRRAPRRLPPASTVTVQRPTPALLRGRNRSTTASPRSIRLSSLLAPRRVLAKRSRASLTALQPWRPSLRASLRPRRTSLPPLLVTAQRQTPVSSQRQSRLRTVCPGLPRPYLTP